MSSVTSANLPGDYPQRIKSARGARGLTQSQFADLIGVSYASVNRWENGQSRPNNLAWRRVVELEKLPGEGIGGVGVDSENRSTPSPGMDFSADPSAVSVVAEAHRLAYGHLFNPAFATETSLIDPLPHQRIAVYDHMLQRSPLRFLLADDAGAGKTIMTGLYVREMLSRRLIRRVLIVTPAGLVGNWEREMRTLFRLPFRIVIGTDTRSGNPFVGAESDRIIVSIDTLTGDRMFGHLKDPSDTGLRPGRLRRGAQAVRRSRAGFSSAEDRPLQVGGSHCWCGGGQTGMVPSLVGPTPSAVDSNAAHGQRPSLLLSVAPVASRHLVDLRRFP